MKPVAHLLSPYVLMGGVILSRERAFYGSTQANLKQSIKNFNPTATCARSLRMYLGCRVVRWVGSS